MTNPAKADILNTRRALPADGWPQVKLLEEVTALCGWRGGYFFFACRNKLMIPMITRQNWKSSEYVSMLSPPPKGGERSPSRNGRANRLPYDWQR